jgi:hypothetical protein
VKKKKVAKNYYALFFFWRKFPFWVPLSLTLNAFRNNYKNVKLIELRYRSC